MRHLLSGLVALGLAACAEAPPTPARPAFIFITATPSPAPSGAPTEEVLPFRDLSTATLTPTVAPVSPTPAPATLTRPAAAQPAAATRPSVAALAIAAPPAAALPTVAPAPTSAPPPTTAPAQPVADVGSAEQAVIDLTNGYRAHSGLAALARDEALMNVARSRSADMVARGYFGHFDPVTGQSLGKPLVLALGYGRTGENIYWSGKSLADISAAAVNWFMGDTPHRANLLNPAYTAIGVGITWNGLGWTLTQNFGGP